MSGHSKWANIKHKKERRDKKKGKIFSMIAKEIISAVKQGGADPETNRKLKIAIQKAKDNNFPNENIERNIRKATTDKKDYISMVYELYGYGGVAIIVNILTDNKNRIASEIRVCVNKCGGSIASSGSCLFNFEKKGILQISKKEIAEEKLFSYVIEEGAEDFDKDEESYIITCDDMYRIKDALEKKGIKVEGFLSMIPKSFVECNREDMEKNRKLLAYLEDIEDVGEVFHNMSNPLD